MFFNSAVGYMGGALNVKLHTKKRKFKAGDIIMLTLDSQLKLTKVSYNWGDEEKRAIFPYIFFVRVPDSESPVLKVKTEVQFKDGTVSEHEHFFDINEM